MKLWEKDKKALDEVLNFTVGNDPEFDRLLAPFDVVSSMAHATMLGKCGLLEEDEAKMLVNKLAEYYPETKKESFRLNKEDEDIHSHLETYLVKELGDTGKKIHTARSRNDQVMTAMLLLMKEEYGEIISKVDSLFKALIKKAEKCKDILIPGYTHTQVAMPSSIALWLGAYAESLVNDLTVSRGIIEVIDQNPLGSAAGYGSSFPIDRDLTTKLAGFSNVQVSSASAQLNRGKMESLMCFGLSSFAITLSRLASDMILFMSQNMAFISFPDELTTGSSIMPHKKNPDVLELIRAHCNTITQMPAMMNSLTTNLVSGYHRDFQLTKEILIPGIEKLKSCLTMMELMLVNMEVAEGILKDERYTYLFSVEEVNKKVIAGLTFRDAYREVGREIESGNFNASGGAEYTHLGSVGNSGLKRIEEKMDALMKQIKIKGIDEVMEQL